MRPPVILHHKPTILWLVVLLLFEYCSWCGYSVVLLSELFFCTAHQSEVSSFTQISHQKRVIPSHRWSVGRWCIIFYETLILIVWSRGIREDLLPSDSSHFLLFFLRSWFKPITFRSGSLMLHQIRGRWKRILSSSFRSLFLNHPLLPPLGFFYTRCMEYHHLHDHVTIRSSSSSLFWSHHKNPFWLF